MHDALRPLLVALPDADKIFRRMYEKDSDFRSLCRDYADALMAIQMRQLSGDTKASQRVVEYQSLVGELQKDIKKYIEVRHYRHDMMKQNDQFTNRDRLYRRLINNIGDEYVMFSHTPEGIFTYMSPGSKALFGREPEELIGKNWRELNPAAECLVEMEAMDKNTIATGIAPPTSFFHYYHPDGIIHTLECENVPVLDESGRVVMIDGIAKDITQRLQLEKSLKKANENLQTMNVRLEELVQERTTALKKSEEKYRRIVTTANEGIITANENFIITFANAVIADMLGGKVEDLIGRPVNDFILQEDRKDHQKQIRDRKKGARAAYERRIRRLDGETRWVLISASPMTDSENRFMGSVAMAIDITDRKRSEQKLKTAYWEISQLKKQIEAEKIYLQEEIKLQYNYDEIVGESKEIKYTLFRVEQVAATESAVIIFGETGTGKELLARAIHNASRRATKPLIKLNCATLPEQFIESELFGHEIGAFTGAVKKRLGRFELAHDSSIFLDEIGELPLPLQAKLLRVLQDGEFERLGDSRTRKSDARIIAATNRDLDQLVREGKFRQDLWYRLNVFPITVPPLRDRKEDIPLLTSHFINKFSIKTGKKINRIPRNIMNELIAYDWPGNIRELEHVIERAMIISPADQFQLAEQFAVTPTATASNKLQPLAAIERKHIIDALEKTNWVIHGPRGAASILELHPNTLRSRMQKLGIHRPKK